IAAPCCARASGKASPRRSTCTAASEGSGEPREEAPGEQIRVTGPACRDVGSVLDHESGLLVGGGPARIERARAALELMLRIPERGLHLVLHVGRIGAVVLAELPERDEVRAALHVLGEACRALRVEDTLPVLRAARPREHQHTVADRGDGATR